MRPDNIEATRTALTKMSSGTEVSAGDWTAIKAEIERKGTVDFRGASGAVTMMPPTVDMAGPYYIEVWKVVGGAYQQVEVRVAQSLVVDSYKRLRASGRQPRGRSTSRHRGARPDEGEPRRRVRRCGIGRRICGCSGDAGIHRDWQGRVGR